MEGRGSFAGVNGEFGRRRYRDKVKIAAEEKEKLGSLGRADGQEIQQIKPLNRGYHPV